MSLNFFQTFPLVTYGDVSLRNIILRAGAARGILEKYGVFYPYRVRDHERADTIAFDYYGDSKFHWLVSLANGVVDPYHDWPLSDADFAAYIVDKYGSYEYAASTVHHYENTDPEVKWWMSPETRSNLEPTERIGHDVEKTVLMWEQEANEEKKTIRLLSNRYAQRAYDELRRSFFVDRE